MEKEFQKIISVNNIFRSFYKRNIINSVSFEVNKGNFFAIKGPNGAGKSTLLRIIVGDLEINKGEIKYYSNSEEVSLKEFLKYSSFAAPYFNLYEEFNLIEMTKLYCQFRSIEFDKSYFENLSEEFLLSNHIQKEIKFYSSGMKQRAKLLLCFYSNSELIILDEPSTNLDLQGIDVLFNKLIEFKNQHKTLILASNEPKELELCDTYYSFY
jgi:ABC-type multidrug transport system ATPase subunit